MRRLWLLPAAMLAGSVALPSGVASAGPAAPTPTARPAGGTQWVTLVTGDRVGVSTDRSGKQQVVTEPLEEHGSFTMTRHGGDLYVIPAAAVPYLGTSLDRSLFDVTALLRDGNTNRIPVQVSGAARVPGLTATGAHDGYLTATAARDFGTALNAQAKRDLRGGLPANRALFGGVTSIRYAGRGPKPAATATAAVPALAERFVVTGPDGKPLADAFLDIINLDDANLFDDFAEVKNGEVSVDLPAGHYSSVVTTFTVNADGDFVSYAGFHDFEVTGDGSTAIDLRTATAQASWTLPRPVRAALDQQAIWLREGVNGALAGSIFGGTIAPFVTPMPAPVVGQRHFVNQAEFASPDGTTPSYGYSLHSPTTADVPAGQHYTVRESDLATLHETFDTEVAGIGNVTNFLVEPWQQGFNAVFRQFRFPTTNTQFVTANGQTARTTTVEAGGSDNQGFGSQLTSGPRLDRPGQQLTEEYWRGPIAPGFPTNVGDDTFSTRLCFACRIGDSVLLFVAPETDSTADHYGQLDFPFADGVTSTSRFQLLSGSTVLADLQNQSGDVFTLAPADTPYKIVYDQTRIAPWFKTAPVSHTEWTFRSAHQDDATPRDPNCPRTGPCDGLPLVDADLHLNAGAQKPGVASMDFTVRHAGFAPQTPIASTRVDLSFDGTHFVPAAVVSLGHGSYRAIWANPNQPGPVTMRIRAADRAGATFDQTIQSAYLIAASA